jgi:hypothetical protein
MGDKPKSAWEIALERLNAEDREGGVVQTPLSEEQKKAIAEAREVCAAALAELQILHADALRKTGDPAARARLEEELQTDRRRREDDRDRRIEKIRAGEL